MLWVRNFVAEDASTLARLMAELGEDSLFPVPVGERLNRPGCRPQEDLFLAGWGSETIACLDTIRELGLGRVLFEGVVLPGYRRRGVASQLLQRGLEHAAAVGAERVQLPIAAENLAAKRLLESRGFTPVRRFLRMSFRGETVAAVPSSPQLRSLRPGEEGVLARIQNLTFGQSWGFQPNTEQEIRYGVSLSLCCPEGIFFALNGEEVVGYCWTRELPTRGNIWMLGVDPRCRGQGVGRALLLRAIHCLRQRGYRQVELTVDSQNTPALRLYRSLGFDCAGEIVWYERELPH